MSFVLFCFFITTQLINKQASEQARQAGRHATVHTHTHPIEKSEMRTMLKTSLSRWKANMRNKAK